VTETEFMQIENIPLQINTPPLEQILVDAQTQGTDLAEKMLKMSSLEQIDQSQLGFIGTIIDLYV
jgi:hypothetical protein